MHRTRRLVAMLLHLAVLLVAPALHAQALGSTRHIAASLVADGAGTPGGTVMLAFVMRPERGWHGYWVNPGDAGLGLDVRWSLPAGGAVGPLQYPVPQTLLVQGLMNHVYESEYAVLTALTLPHDARPGTVLPVTAEANWLTCSADLCVPEHATLTAQVAVVAPGSASPRDPRFDAWRARLPAPLGAQAHFAVAGGTVRIAIPLPASVALDQPHLFVAADHLVDYAAPQLFYRDGDLVVVKLARPKLLAASPQQVPAVLRLNRAGDGLAFTAMPGGVPAAGTPLGDAIPLARLPLLLAAALLGGLLLNVMPCVFPILSLKALSLARAGESEAEARTEGLAYSAGVVLATLALGGLLLALRAGGAQVGWAFQLQEPAVVVALLLVATAITANLLGTFELAIPGFARAGAPQGAFATGLLAAFVATPCTGPFMAAAMGAALLLPTLLALGLFAALGLGLALPFLAIAFVPVLRRALPRPGRWMVTFRKAMAVPMGLTGLALLWLLSRLGGRAFALTAAVAAVGTVAVLVAVGRAQRAGSADSRRFAWALVPLLLMAAIVLRQDYAPPAAGGSQGVLPAQPFSEAALAKARAAGRPVFVWLTADWCLTCKVNEEVAIERTATRDAFAKADVVVLRGDWTRRDPAITRYLTAQGAAGVPLYVWYPKGGGAPRQLPQVLTPGELEALAQ